MSTSASLTMEEDSGASVRCCSRVSLSPSLVAPRDVATIMAPNINVVINPYNKTKHCSDFIPDSRRRLFADESRKLALEHGMTKKMSSPLSAMDIRTATRKWRRRSPRRTHDGEVDKYRPSYNSFRPRLFLLSCSQRLEEEGACDRTNDNVEMTKGQPQSRGRRHREEGLWELDRGITEISGEGGSGKTQICLSLCVSCVMSPFLHPGSSNNYFVDRTGEGPDGGHYKAIYVSMGEGIRSVTIARRLEQMVRARLNNDGNNVDEVSICNDAIIKRILSRIILISIHNEDEFADFVDGDLPDLLYRIDDCNGLRRRWTKIGLVALDGIAGFFRFSDLSSLNRHDEKSLFFQCRGPRLLRLSSRLRELSDVYDVPVLITNQVTAFAEQISASCPEPSSVLSTTNFGEQLRWAVPALGLAWSNCVTTRYILRRTERVVDASVDMIGCGRKRPVDAEGKKIIAGTRKLMRVREACILQSVNMPADLQVRFVIDSGDVLVVA